MSDDEDFQRAIALSLQESQPASASQLELHDDEDAFQADLLRAIEASKATASHPRASGCASDSETAAPPTSEGSSTFMSDRAQMEKARLERQKRLRKEDSQTDQSDFRPAKRHASESSYESSASESVSGKSAVSNHATHASTEQGFCDGEMRQTANRHATSSKDTRPTFRLSEVIGKKSDIAFAIISSYTTVVPWIYTFFEPSTPVILVAQPDQTGSTSLKEVLPNWIMTTPFLRNGRGCMHMKFMLLFYKTGRLRVVVSTANLVDFDWRDIENSVWLQDIPRRSSPVARDPKATDFAASFQHVLNSLNVANAISIHIANDHPHLPLQSVNELRTHWDWSKVKAELVPSIAGKHEGWPKVIMTGHTALMKAVRNINARAGPNREVVLECQGSSIGTYSTQWMNEFHHSARGDSAEDWLDEPRSRRTQLPYPTIKIVFPSVQTVQDSVLREPGGGTIFCRANQWAAPKFPRELFHDSKSKRGGLLMHSKMIIATFKDRRGVSGSASGKGKSKQLASDTEDEDDARVAAGSSGQVGGAKQDLQGIDESGRIYGWAYVGSHNFTPSAWGTLSGSAFNPSLNIVNYELGVLVPLHDATDADRFSCWERPPRKYVTGKDRPWMQEQFLGQEGS